VKAKDRKPPIAADGVPPDAELDGVAPLTTEELIMSLTSKMPADYADLDDAKKKKVELCLTNLNNGVGLVEACNNAGMSDVTFYRYRKAYPWIQQAMDTITEARLQVVEDTLYRSAIGYSYQTTERRQKEVVNAAGARQGNVERSAVTKEVHIEPSTTACIFWLKNRSRGRWRNDHSITFESSHTERRELAIGVEVRRMVSEMSTDDLEVIHEIGARLTGEAAKRLVEDDDDGGG
jgi:hypothetical protein